MRTHSFTRWSAVLVSLLATAACSSSKDASDETTVVATTATTVPVSSTAPATSEATTQPTTTEAATTTPATVAPTTTAAPATTVPTGVTPGAVTITYAGSGGGSGEIQLDWNATTNATSYRVYRAATLGGPFTMMASINVVTGATNVHDGVVNVWGNHQTFVPGPYTSSGVSTQFHYVEVPFAGGGSHGYFRVIAYNANGRGPIGATVCAQPYGVTAC